MANKNNVIKLFPDTKIRNATHPTPLRKNRVSSIQNAASAILRTSYTAALVA